MARMLTYALMSNAVYDADPRLDGWTRVGFRPSGGGLTDAFQGVAFRQGHEIVFAFKGTSNGRDAIADAKLGVGMNTHQYARAGEFVAQVPLHGCSVSITGHSLGGAIAQIIGNRHRLPFVTFNAPGVGLVSRNAGEVAATMGLGTAVVRTAGATLSALMHPMQAAQDAGSLFYRVRGVNFRVGKDVVGSIGVHYGRVVELAYAGGAMDLIEKHRMPAVLSSLSASSYREQELDAVV
jgi:hypothetical protein